MFDPALVKAIVIMGGLGVIIGIGLAAASKIFYVYVDPLILAVDDALPGANCGGCGLPGCSANAEAIVAGKAAPNSCVAGGPELADTIAAILGVSVEAKEPDIALPGCTYGVEDADIKYLYNGITDCRAAALLSGGMKMCNIGCLGLGTCAKACPFGAITMGEDHLPVVDETLCTGCGTCERVCPKHIITLSSVTRRIIREYTSDDCTTPCQRNCPAGINISEYIRQITLGDYHRSVQVIKERNPFPTVIGRICPRPCENECRRKHIDEPVAINGLKRFVADYERSRNERILPFKAPETGRKIAVVGGGVEGLSAAFFSARLGHTVNLFEGTDKMGGLLRTAIARNRLAMDILDWDIQGILEMGVTAQTGQMLGRDFTIDALLANGHDAVFVATGGWDNRLARGAGKAVENAIPGVFLLIDLLKASPEQLESIPIKGDIVIIGSDKAAVRAATKCKEHGARSVSLLVHETETASLLETDDAEALAAAGVTVNYAAGVTRINGSGDELREVEVVNQTTLEKKHMPAQALFLSAGRFPEMIFTRPDSEEDNTGSRDWTGMQPIKKPTADTENGLLASGDPLTDISAAIKAIAAGRRGAASIHQALYGLDMDLPENVLTPDTPVQNVYHLEAVNTIPRNPMPLCAPEDRISDVELELGFDEATAKNEAERCLRCGLVCYQRTNNDIQPATATGALSLRRSEKAPEPFCFDERNRVC